MRITRHNKVKIQAIMFLLTFLLGSMALGSHCFVSKQVLLAVIQK